LPRFFGSGSVGSGAGVSFPSGSIIMFGGEGASPPAGWLLCDGASLLRASFVALFNAIGVLYGSVDGTHFNLPLFNDSRKPRGAVNDAGRGTTGGANSVTLTALESGLRSHLHEIQGNTGTGASANGAVLPPVNQAVTGRNTENVSALPADDAHENQSLFVDVNFLIHV